MVKYIWSDVEITFYTLDSSIRQARIMFDNLVSDTENCFEIPNFYRGLNWTDFLYTQKLYWKKFCPSTEFVTAPTPNISAHVAFFNNEASISGKFLSTFNLISFTVCSAFNDDQVLTIQSYCNSVETNQHTMTLLFGKPEFILLAWKNINRVTFRTFGGTSHNDDGQPYCSYAIITQITIGALP